MINRDNFAFVAHFFEGTGTVQVANLHHVDAKSAPFVPLAGTKLGRRGQTVQEEFRGLVRQLLMSLSEFEEECRGLGRLARVLRGEVEATRVSLHFLRIHILIPFLLTANVR